MTKSPSTALSHSYVSIEELIKNKIAQQQREVESMHVLTPVYATVIKWLKKLDLPNKTEVQVENCGIYINIQALPTDDGKIIHSHMQDLAKLLHQNKHKENASFSLRTTGGTPILEADYALTLNNNYYYITLAFHLPETGIQNVHITHIPYTYTGIRTKVKIDDIED